MRPVLAAFEQEHTAPAYDDFAMVDKQIEHLADIERFGPVVDKRYVGDCEGGLQLCELEKFVQRDLRVAIFFDFDHDSHTISA